jgi:alpha/beta superfamily hydrolase
VSRTAAPVSGHYHGARVGGTQEGALVKTVREFAAAGFTVLTFGYRNFGDSGGAPWQVSSIQEQRADRYAALTPARQITSINPSRVTLWGSSLGDTHVVANFVVNRW